MPINAFTILSFTQVIFTVFRKLPQIEANYKSVIEIRKSNHISNKYASTKVYKWLRRNLQTI